VFVEDEFITHIQTFTYTFIHPLTPSVYRRCMYLTRLSLPLRSADEDTKSTHRVHHLFEDKVSKAHTSRARQIGLELARVQAAFESKIFLLTRLNLDYLSVSGAHLYFKYIYMEIINCDLFININS
jgi:hypothetical protein